jgi:hypothetical protein
MFANDYNLPNRPPMTEEEIAEQEAWMAAEVAALHTPCTADTVTREMLEE